MVDDEDTLRVWIGFKNKMGEWSWVKPYRYTSTVYATGSPNIVVARYELEAFSELLKKEKNNGQK